ncbi:MAG: FAD-dependent oxidoreductase [Proteobacteria bacterium]|nr:FAD-dependent oxidoreductase [Pseudomonadota bacterium]
MADLIVIGAGLSGLAVARRASASGADVVVLEARARVGGRVLSHRTRSGAYDLGPAWIWPAIQPRVAQAAREAGLILIEQTAAGDFVYQDHSGRTQRLSHGFAQEPPSMRIVGGVTALVEAVASGLAPTVVRLEHVARRVVLTGAGVEVTVETPAGALTLHAPRLVLAMPPRLVGQLAIIPALPLAVQQVLAAAPGWMAGQAKALALYDRPVWRDSGLSGGAFSQAGPLGEIHDASLPGAAEAALFGFFAWPPALRATPRADLRSLVARQLRTLFGADAAPPREVIIQDWIREPFTATMADHHDDNSHPNYRPIRFPAPWGERIILAGTEVAAAFAGYLEGALAAAEAAVTGTASASSG